MHSAADVIGMHNSPVVVCVCVQQFHSATVAFYCVYGAFVGNFFLIRAAYNDPERCALFN